VGASGSTDCNRRRHWFQSAGFGIGTRPGQRGPGPQPFFTVGDARKVLTSGAWHEQRSTDPSLRLPDEMIGPDQARQPDIPLLGVTFREAEVFASWKGSKLPTEREADLIASTLEAIPPAVPRSFVAWTSSPWSEFSYSACVWDMKHSRWRQPRFEPRIGEKRDERRSVLRVDLETHEIRREPSEPGNSNGVAVWVVHG